MAIMTFDRIVIVAASSGLSSMASHTLANVFVLVRSSLQLPQSRRRKLQVAPGGLPGSPGRLDTKLILIR
jgi:hypothetical protein